MVVLVHHDITGLLQSTVVAGTRVVMKMEATHMQWTEQAVVAAVLRAIALYMHLAAAGGRARGGLAAPASS